MRACIIGVFILGIAARAGADPLAAADPLSTEPQPEPQPQPQPQLQLQPQPGLAVDFGQPRLIDRSGLPDHALHLDFGTGADVGRVNAGNMTAYSGLHMLFGPRTGRVSLLGELDLAATQSRDRARVLGVYERVALETRVSLWQGRFGGLLSSAAPTEISRADLWLEAGIGYENASQMNMDTLARRDVSFALGLQKSFHYESRAFGAYFAVRVIEAQPATAGHGPDVGVMLTSGVMFGRR